MSTLARTENTVKASTQLTRLASRIPSGPRCWPRRGRATSGSIALIPRGRSSRQRDRSSTTSTDSSRVQSKRQSTGDRLGLLDLHNSRIGQCGYGTPAYARHGTVQRPAPVPTPSLDSVRIQNTTGLALLVTVHLECRRSSSRGSPRRFPRRGTRSCTFNFGTATNAFMTMDVSLADGGQTPPPFSNVSLSQPMSGYNGALFAISLLGPYFNVTPL